MAKLDLTKYGITGTTEIVYNPSYEQLFEEETKPGLEGYEKGQVSELGAVNVMTGIYTGRSPKDKFIVMDENSKDTVWWMRAAEMDTVIGLSKDSQCILTLYSKPCKGPGLPASAREDVERRCRGARHAGKSDREAPLPAPIRARPHGQRVRVLGHGGPRALGLPRDGPD